MNEIEIEIIRLALSTEVEHKDYEAHNLAACQVLNAHENALKQGQSLPIYSVSNCLEFKENFNNSSYCKKCGEHKIDH